MPAQIARTESSKSVPDSAIALCVWPTLRQTPRSPLSRRTAATSRSLARENVRKAGYADRIRIVHARGIDFLVGYNQQVDIIFCDCDVDEYADYPAHALRLLRVGGVLITANLFAGWYTPGMPGLDAAISYRDQVLADSRLHTTFLGSNAITLRIR